MKTETLETLQAAVSLQRLAEGRGVKLKRKGAVLVGSCPFHTAEDNALVIDPKANTWTCSGCNIENGSVITWVMTAEGISKKHALELIRNDKLPVTNPEIVTVKKSTTKKLEPFVSVGSADEVVLSRVVEFYAETLRGSPEALEYLKQRKLDSQELIQHFRIGYSNRTLGYRLPESNRKTGAALRGQLVRLGIFRTTGHEHLSGSVVVPILDEDGSILDMYGRKVTYKLRAGTDLHVTLGETPKGIFNVTGIQNASEVIVTKSVMDALSFWAGGHRNAIATYGLNGFTEVHREAFRKYHVKKILIAFDRSKKGDAAAAQLGDGLARDGLQVFRIVFPWGMDANDYLRSGESFDALVRAAQWVGGTRSSTVPETITTPIQTKPEIATPSASDGHGSSVPAVPVGEHQAVEVASNEVLMRFGPRTWRVRGHEGCTSLASIRVNIRVATDYGFFSDTMDILSARARGSFLKQAREELEVEERILKSDLGHVVLKVEELVDVALRERLEPKQAVYSMGETERDEALALLRDPRLVERIISDFDKCGIVGEADNKLIGYLATISRRLDEPLAIVIQSSSAAGKSSLLDAILRFVPEEEQVSYSAMTGQSLYYMGSADLKHKVLAIQEEAGVTQAAYALRVLQSSGELSIASTGKDQTTGRLSAHEYKVEGPVAILMTTTAIDVDDELLSRCIVLTIDETPEQTVAIQELQRKARTLDGLLAQRARLDIERLHQNAQRLLVPLAVVNPFAPEMVFGSNTTRSRRDQKKLLTLIDTIAFLHQHQRPVKKAEIGNSTIKYVEVMKADIELAMKLSKHLFGSEDIPPQTGKMLAAINSMVAGEAKEQATDPREVRFTRRELREQFGWSVTQTRVHLDRLTELEYVIKHRGSNGQRYLYRLADTGTMQTWRGVTGTWRSEKSQVVANEIQNIGQPDGLSQKARLRGNGKTGSYRNRSSTRSR